MNESSNILGTGHEFEACGRMWTFSPLTPGIRNALTDWCRRQAHNGIVRDRAYVGEDGYMDRMKALNSAVAAGDYSWRHPTRMGAVIREAVMSPNADGQVRLMQLLLEKKHGEVSEDEVREIVEDEASRDEMTWALKGAMGTRGPNEKPPAKRTPATKEEEATSPSAT